MDPMNRCSTIVVFVFIVTIFLVWSRYNYLSTLNSQSQAILEEIKRFEEGLPINRKVKDLNDTQITEWRKKLKYILIWTHPHHDPLMYLGKGQETFIMKKCSMTNCYITTNKNYYKDITEFDVILFNGPEVVDKRKPVLPTKRDPKQNYVFASIESSDYYPICDNKFDGYFNVSWTYKLNSDISYGYVIARNMEGKVIGPKREMHWISIDDMKSINETIKQKLSSKKKLAAWLVSNCGAPSRRDTFVKKVQSHLRKMGVDWKVDVFGNCGTIPCARSEMPRCLQMFENDYYFYFSFENSFTEDYVTEKILHPLQHYGVPVVYGTANYTRYTF